MAEVRWIVLHVGVCQFHGWSLEDQKLVTSSSTVDIIS